MLCLLGNLMSSPNRVDTVLALMLRFATSHMKPPSTLNSSDGIYSNHKLNHTITRPNTVLIVAQIPTVPQLVLI